MSTGCPVERKVSIVPIARKFVDLTDAQRKLADCIDLLGRTGCDRLVSELTTVSVTLNVRIRQLKRLLELV